MGITNKCFEALYPAISRLVFDLSSADPEKAHDLMIKASPLMGKILSKVSIRPSGMILSNAAGLNKNGDVSMDFLQAVGFQRCVVGTVTAKPFHGNPKPRVWRFPKHQSTINCLGLPNLGAEAVRSNLEKSMNDSLPVTLNIANTPQIKQDIDVRIEDLLTAMRPFRDMRTLDRIELNISCPNTEDHQGGDYLAKFAEGLKETIQALRNENPGLALYLKVSPDAKTDWNDLFVKLTEEGMLDGITACNTTLQREYSIFPGDTPPGGAGGRAVYDLSKKFREKLINSGYPKSGIIACGGLDSGEKVRQEFINGINEVQIYTPFIFQGPSLLRKIHSVI